MSQVKIKVCGITELSQAVMMEAMGVEFLGFNFVPSSPRFIDAKAAAEITQEVPVGAAIVGVFQNPSVAEVEAVLKHCPLDYLQFHGTETPDFVSKFAIPVIKVFSVDADFDAEVLKKYEDVVEYFLFDSKVGNVLGGTGVVFDWQQVSDIHVSKPIFLAGGLGVNNVEEAVTTVSPFALDLNSKIETEPGIKDLDLLQECLDKVSL